MPLILFVLNTYYCRNQKGWKGGKRWWNTKFVSITFCCSRSVTKSHEINEGKNLELLRQESSETFLISLGTSHENTLTNYHFPSDKKFAIFTQFPPYHSDMTQEMLGIITFLRRTLTRLSTKNCIKWSDFEISFIYKCNKR